MLPSIMSQMAARAQGPQEQGPRDLQGVKPVCDLEPWGELPTELAVALSSLEDDTAEPVPVPWIA